MSDNTAAIVVSFHPEIYQLDRLLSALKMQVEEIVVVDNGSSPEAISWLFRQSLEFRIHLLSLGDNFGIGFAQNRGIELAIDRGHQRFLLVDQDSLPESGMVVALERVLDELVQSGIKVGAVGPTRKDESDPSQTIFLTFNRFPPNRACCNDSTPLVNADVLISSGMLIPMQAIKDVGLMDERLFIDHVETDWCFRGLALGFRFYGVCDARMLHKLGNGMAKPWYGRRSNMNVHVLVRNYYFVRNSIILIRRTYIPGPWKWYMTWTLTKFCVCNSFKSPHARRILLMVRGIAHASIGRLGRLY